ELLAIDPSTATSRAARSLTAPPNACDNEDDGSELAAIGRDVFMLLPGAPGASVLYRAAT
ncbi:MAG TPA: hypothetical protein VIY26_05925, partial [Acidimicrobiales bacterium]